ncbi:MAG: AraC family transcriptional regulator [Hydrogenophaga sp.]|nr:AraC family transcriptional regulator [Hydrogenophaga sp.]
MESDRSFGRHWHDSYGFGVMDQGGHRSASGRGPVEALAGDIVTSNPGEVHDGSPVDRSVRRWRMVHVSPDAMEDLTGLGAQEITRPVFDDPRLRSAIARVFACWDALSHDPRPPDSDALWEEALAQACGQLMQLHGNRANPTSVPAHLDDVRECLLDQVAAPPSLSELATLASLSRYQLVRQFASAHGLPPFAWLLQHRLLRARRLIAGGVSLGEAAAECGFSDQSHLHRHFVRCFGFTPGQWRRAVRGPLQ